jgi:hypothetical protein
MSCNNFRQHVRSWLRGELSAADASEVERHVAGCYFCAAIVENESLIIEGLQKRYDVPPPSPDFESRVMAAALSRGKSAERPITMAWVSGAVAAVLALGVALGIGMGSDSDMPESQPYNVRLAFDTVNAMDDVTLTVELPPHVEMSGYPGYQRLSWNVSLDKGENVVNLPLNILFPGEGDLVAHLDNGERKKTFRASLTGGQTHSGASGASEPVL